MIVSCHDAQGKANAESKKDRHQPNLCRNLPRLRNQFGDGGGWLLIRDTEIETYGIGHVVDVLLPNRLIQSILAQDIGFGGGRKRLFSFIEGATGDSMHHAEGNHGDGENNKYE